MPQDNIMITVDNLLSEQVARQGYWPIKNEHSPLACSYRKMRTAIYNGDLKWQSNHSRTRPSAYGCNAMAIMCRNTSVLKELTKNDKYIYLTPTKLFIQQIFTSPYVYAYVAILKWEGRIGYTVLILDLGAMDYAFSAPGYREYAGNFGLMEVLPDGTIVFFNRTLPWRTVMQSRANTTSIREMFFNEEEIRSIGSIIDHVTSSQCIDKDEIYTHRIGDVSYKMNDTPF